MPCVRGAYAQPGANRHWPAGDNPNITPSFAIEDRVAASSGRQRFFQSQGACHPCCGAVCLESLEFPEKRQTRGKVFCPKDSLSG
jgi:hypothetical protein